jgi:ABC-type transport system substrate-binding protein
MPGYDVDDAVQRFDPAEARRLLASSRYAGTDALRTIVKPRDLRPASRITDEWLVSQWRTNLGVEVRSDAMPGPAIAQLFRKPETTPQFWGPDGFCADYPDQHDFLTVVFHSSVKDGWREIAGFADPEFDRLVEQADRERDQARRDDLFRRASRIVSERAVFAMLLTGGSLSLRKPWVKGVAEGALVYYLGGASSEQVFVMRKGS